MTCRAGSSRRNPVKAEAQRRRASEFRMKPNSCFRLHHGIGTFLLKHLMRIARRNGISGFTAEVLTENKPMQAVINKSNCKIKSKFAGNVHSYEMDFE